MSYRAVHRRTCRRSAKSGGARPRTLAAPAVSSTGGRQSFSGAALDRTRVPLLVYPNRFGKRGVCAPSRSLERICAHPQVSGILDHCQ